MQYFLFLIKKSLFTLNARVNHLSQNSKAKISGIEYVYTIYEIKQHFNQKNL